MKILVVGNGFDIAHGLPTAYPQFLDFVKEFRGKASNQDNGNSDISEFINRIKLATEGDLAQLNELLSKENKLLDYFLGIYNDRCREGKDKWVDFETEISSIIKAFDKIYDIEKEKETNGKLNYRVDAYLQKKVGFLFLSDDILALDRSKHYINKSFTIGFFEPYIKDLLAYLNELTRIFELYLVEYVEKIETQKRIPQIYELKNIDCLISFNYTDTFRRLYKKDDLRCCFIHGKAKEDSSIESCNLVLGIDEYLSGERQDNDNRFAWFKKFYQRIYKETSSAYIDWLEEDIEENSKNGIPLYIYFYGHSLNSTDRDVLYNLIMHENAIIRIFYHKREALAGQIKNLIQIIGEKNLIHLTHGSQRRIHFVQSDEAVDQRIIEEEIKAGRYYALEPNYNHV